MKAPDLPILDAQRTPCASPKAEAKLSKYQQRKVTKSVRAQVFEREQGMCRCCGFRAAESMHELRPRSLGGKRSLENSIAVCGSGTTGCHGLLQTYRVRFYLSGACGAQGPMKFEPLTAAAIDWLVRL